MIDFRNPCSRKRYTLCIFEKIRVTHFHTCKRI
nr:MAG TPA: hypothetical protein [Caudoviricetes sp.]